MGYFRRRTFRSRGYARRRVMTFGRSLARRALWRRRRYVRRLRY